MQPYDYTGAFAGIGPAYEAAMRGLKDGLAINQVQAQQQQQQAALAQQQQQQEVIRRLISNREAGAEEYANAITLVPGMSEQLKQAWDIRNTAQQQQHLSDLVQWGAAIQNGRPEIAADAIMAKADAIENTAKGPTRESQALRAQAQTVKEHPEFGGYIIKSMLAAHPNGGKAIESIVKQAQEGRDAAKAPAELREANAKAGGAEADTTLKNLGIVGQTLGALQGKKIKPEQARAAIATLVARGAIPKEERQTWFDAIPTDPAQMDTWLETMRAAGMKPDEQMKYTRPDANTVANNATSRANTRDNNQTQMAVQDRIDARRNAASDVEANLDPETLTLMAEQYLAGDRSALQNLGRGNQGSANLVAVRQEITRLARERGMNGPQIAAVIADYNGLSAGMRVTAGISARVENAISEARELAPLAIAASRDVVRSGLLPFGKAQVMFNTQTNDPALKKFAAANVGFVQAYAGAMARGQKPTVHDKEHAEKLISEAVNQEAYEAIMGQLMLEMDAASRAPQNVRKHLRGEISGDHGGGHGGPAVGTVEQGYRFKGGDPSKSSSWEKVK